MCDGVGAATFHDDGLPQKKSCRTIRVKKLLQSLVTTPSKSSAPVSQAKGKVELAASQRQSRVSKLGCQGRG